MILVIYNPYHCARFLRDTLAISFIHIVLVCYMLRNYNIYWALWPHLNRLVNSRVNLMKVLLNCQKLTYELEWMILKILNY